LWCAGATVAFLLFRNVDGPVLIGWLLATLPLGLADLVLLQFLALASFAIPQTIAAHIIVASASLGFVAVQVVVARVLVNTLLPVSGRQQRGVHRLRFCAGRL